MPKTILIVDDDRVSTEITKRTLQNNGYDVLVAGDGQEALDLLNSKIPDLILLDVQMPIMDGYTFIVKKGANPAFSKIPVIVLSSMEKTAPMFKRHGVKHYLIKPLNTQELLEKIQVITAS